MATGRNSSPSASVYRRSPFKTVFAPVLVALRPLERVKYIVVIFRRRFAGQFVVSFSARIIQFPALIQFPEPIQFPGLAQPLVRYRRTAPDLVQHKRFPHRIPFREEKNNDRGRTNS